MKHPDLARYIYENSEQAAIRIVNLEREVAFLRKDVYFRAPSAVSSDDGLRWKDAYHELERENTTLKIERNRYKVALKDIADAANLWSESWEGSKIDRALKEGGQP
jgi:hypothetical protein